MVDTGAGLAVNGEIIFELRGRDAVIGQLRDASARLGDATPLYDLIGASLVASTVDRFEREMDPEGSPWPPSLRVQFEGGKTLTDSANLRNSVTHEPSATGVEVGTNVIYGRTHQFGAVIKPIAADALHFTIGGADVFVKQVTIPRRAFLGIDDDDETAIYDIIGQYVGEPIGGVDAR